MPQFPPKAYKNLEFLNSPAARHIRILCEYEETRQRFRRHGIKNTLVFFGSARVRPREESEARVTEARAALEADPEDPTLQAELQRCEAVSRLSPYYDHAVELSRRLTEWSLGRDGKRGYYVTSGGGPGIMEAANRGAAMVKKGRSLGLGISLPFEPGVNDFATPELSFEFHYFFTRKLWFLYLCKGLVIFPGGFGTMDEMFETLTLVQTKKIQRVLPVVLFGREYWDEVLHLDVMVRFGTIAPRDMDLVHRTDSVDDAFEFLTTTLEQQEEAGAVGR